MDRLTTGRRHVRAGSVTVTELLVKQASPALCTDSSPTERDDITDDITDVIPVIGPASHRRHPPRGAHFAKLASLGVAGAVLCGAVTVSSLIAQQRRENAQPQARPTAQITGDEALLPDRLDRSLPKATAPRKAPPAAVPPATRRGPASSAPAPPATHAPTSAKTNSGASVTTPSAVADAENDLDLVREFYENLPDAPASAFQLLSPQLLHSGFREFLQAWSHVVSIDSLTVLQQADGVLATVRMRLLGGGHLRIQQLVTVAESPHRIIGVQLLSAQRN